jgi:hypothetical protein
MGCTTDQDYIHMLMSPYKKLLMDAVIYPVVGEDWRRTRDKILLSKFSAQTMKLPI